MSEVKETSGVSTGGEPSRASPKLRERMTSVASFARSWLDAAKETFRQDKRRHETLLNAESMIPKSQDPESFSFWLASLSDLGSSERLALVRFQDTAERIRYGLMKLENQMQD